MGDHFIEEIKRENITIHVATININLFFLPARSKMKKLSYDNHMTESQCHTPCEVEITYHSNQ